MHPFNVATRLVSLAAVALCCAPARSADDSVLALVPKDAAAFVHIRVGDLWKHDSFKSVREFVTKTEPGLLRELEKEMGFLPSDLESVTLIFPELSNTKSPGEPLVAVRFEKPFDKAKLLASMKASTPGGYGDDDFMGDMSPPRKGSYKYDVKEPSKSPTPSPRPSKSPTPSPRPPVPQELKKAPWSGRRQ